MIDSITGGYLTAEIAGIILFLIGVYGLMTKEDLIKQVLAINIISAGIVLYFVGVAYVSGGGVPILPNDKVVDPLPATLVLTGFVVDVAITALALAIIIRIKGERK